MEPNKIDTKIKEKLVSREIKPSAQAWDRLDAMLSVTENKKKKSYSWLYIAASFILFATIGFWFYNQGNTDGSIINENTVVITKESKKQIDTLKNNNNQNQEDFISKSVEVIVENDKRQDVKKESILNSNKVRNQIQNEVKTNEIAENNSQQAEVIEVKNKYITGEMILASVENRKVENKENLNLNNEVKTKIRVNTSSLLSSVETELDENHKETAIDKLSRNFKQVKSALANRNYEE